MRLQFLLILILTGVFGAGAAAQTFVADLDAANHLYDQGRYSEAAGAYQRMIQSGSASAAAYFNLGNSLLKSGQVGRAIAVYRTLEAATPRDPDLRANLNFALNQVKGPTIRSDRLHTWLDRLSVNEWTIACAVAVWTVLLLLTVGQARPALVRALRPWVLLALLATVLVAVGLGLSLSAAWEPKAIVVVAEAPVRQAPLDDAATVFSLYDGAEVRVLDRTGEWIQVAVDERRAGWVRAAQVVASK